MMKKILSVIGCLVPFGANAVVELTPDNYATEFPSWNKPIGGIVGADSSAVPLTGINVYDGGVEDRGAGLNLQATALNIRADADGVSQGLTASQNFVVGKPANEGAGKGSVFVTVGKNVLNEDGSTQFVASDTFDIVSAGDISVGGGLTVNDGFTLGIQTPQGGVINASFGSVEAVGALNIKNIGVLDVTGNLTSYNALNVASTNTMNVGALQIKSGGADVNLTGALNVKNGSIYNTYVDGVDGDVSIVAASANVAQGIQNNTGDMVINLGGGSLTAGGTVENTGFADSMEIKAGDVIVAGTMKNDVADAVMRLDVNSLQINGGDADNPSLVNKGDFYATVAGKTHFMNGMSLVDMASSNVFDLTTGQLTFGANVTGDALAKMFTSNLVGSVDAEGNITGGFKLNITNDDFDFTDASGAGVRVVNGNPQNVNATMDLTAQNFNITGIDNYGTLNLKSTENQTGVAPVTNVESKGVYVSGDITGYAGSTTTITSNANIIAATGVTNSGNMVLNGVNVGVASVANNAGDLKIQASTSNGMVCVDGNVATAAGDVDIWGRDIQIGGKIISTGGTTTIKSSENADRDVQLKLAGIDVLGGTVSLNSLVSRIDMTQGLVVRGFNQAEGIAGGTLNIGYAQTSAPNLVNVTGAVRIDGNVTAKDITSADMAGTNGDVNIDTTSGVFTLVSGDSGAGDSIIDIAGDVVAVAADAERAIAFDAATMNVGGNVTVANKGKVILGSLDGNAPVPAVAEWNPPAYSYQTVDVAGDVSVTQGGKLDIYALHSTFGSLTLDAQSKLAMFGNMIEADSGDIKIDGGILFDGTDANKGLVVNNADGILDMQTTSDGADIDIGGGVTVGEGRQLLIASKDTVSVSGAVDNKGLINVNAIGAAAFTNGAVQNTAGEFYVTADSISMQDLTNAGTATLTAQDGVTAGLIKSSGVTTINAGAAGVLDARSVEVTSGQMDIVAAVVKADVLTLAGGTTDITAQDVTVDGAAMITGDVNQGVASNAALDLLTDGMVLYADSLNVSGKLNAAANSVRYRALDGSATFAGGIDVAAGAGIDVMALNNIAAGAITNAGTLDLFAAGGAITGGDFTNNAGTATLQGVAGITLGALVVNDGDVTLDAVVGQNYIDATSVKMNGGTLALSGGGLRVAGPIETAGVLYQNAFEGIDATDINVLESDFEIRTTNLKVGEIAQESGSMQIYTGDVTVGGDIDASDLRFVTSGATDYLDVLVNGNVSGNVDFVGLEQMTITGDYRFNNNSAVNAVILDRKTTPYDYWATVSLNDDLTLGDITNGTGDNVRALIEVGGQFTTDLAWDKLGTGANGVSLANGQMGITLFDIVDQGSAIWLLHAEDGIDELAAKIRNLNVNFCNADGSLCFNYLDSYDVNNASGEKLPVYISVRDTNADNEGDSLYIVFDPRFGGPVEVFKIQPIVGKVPGHTTGEYVSAGALDDMIIGQLMNKGFNNRTPIEAIPHAFKGTNLETVANELYARMENYVLNRDEAQFVPFSRLFQVRELEQVMGALSLNEHTNFRSFEDRMFDEFIWNRNRNLKKAWADVDFGMFVQDVDDGKRVDGNRFNVSGGFDWQESETLILGVTGRVSHMSSTNSDSMNLGYLPNTFIAGHMSTDVADTNIGLGGYMMKILGNKTRLYGNAFLDLHLFDIKRQQNFVADITGDGTSFALTTEWGLMHDLLNQYIVGNVYARLGYNFGVDITEKAAGADYMKLESDGYAILTPGYSLTAQKRIYPSAWFQIRPYATIGIEYDVLGMPDHARYKFAPAHRFTDFDIDIDPMWANIGGGFEFLSATGVQVGIDYRYQYNQDLQLHNIKVSGSYRF